MLDRSRDCAICLQEWQVPVACWPCGHVFCLSCLDALMKYNNWDERWFRVVPCQLCRQLVIWTSFIEKKDRVRLSPEVALPGRWLNRLLPRRAIEHAVQLDKVIPQLDPSSLVIFLVLILLSFALTILSLLPAIQNVYMFFIHDFLVESLLSGFARESAEFFISALMPTLSLTACAVLALVIIFVW